MGARNHRCPARLPNKTNMGGTRKRRIVAAIALGLIAVIVAGGVDLATGPQPAWLASRWPIDLSHPVEHLADWRLRALRADRLLCRVVLKAPEADTTETADTLATPGAPESNGGCGWSNSVRLSGLGYARISVDKLTCEMTAAMALWVAHDVQPAAEAMFGERVRAIRHLGSYACRTIRGNPAHAHVVSEHARANALDIQAFVLTSGRQVSVLQHWGHAGKDGEFLAAVHSKACRYFRVAIGPAYNAAHRDHFHYDRGFYSACK